MRHKCRATPTASSWSALRNASVNVKTSLGRPARKRRATAGCIRSRAGTSFALGWGSSIPHTSDGADGMEPSRPCSASRSRRQRPVNVRRGLAVAWVRSGAHDVVKAGFLLRLWCWWNSRGRKTAGGPKSSTRHVCRHRPAPCPASVPFRRRAVRSLLGLPWPTSKLLVIAAGVEP